MTQTKLNLFKKLFVLQQGKCIICGKFMSGVRSSIQINSTASREHIVPKCYGGQNQDNILLSCTYCNRTRNTKPLKNMNKIFKLLNLARIN